MGRRMNAELLGWPAAIGKKNPLKNIMTSLVSYWPLNESSAGSAAVTRLDAYAFKQLTDVSPYAPSANGHASFTTANKEYLTIADNANMSLGADTSFSITAKIKPGGAGTNRSIIAKALGANNQNIEYMLFLTSTNITGLRVGNGTTYMDVGSAVTISNGQTYEIFCGYDAATARLWITVNNEAVRYANWAGKTQDTAGSCNIGRAGGANDNLYFQGEIWDVSFWKRLLTPAEIAALRGKSYPWGMAGYTYTETQPSAVGSKDYWLDFSDVTTLYTDAGKTTPVAADGDAIRVAADKFGGAFAATAPSDGVRPVYKTGVQNSLGAGLWNGTDSQLDHPAWTDGDFTCFWVVKNLDMIKGSHVSEGNRYLAITGTSYDATPRAVCHIANNVSVAAFLPDPTGFIIVEMVHSGGLWSMWASGQTGNLDSAIDSVYNPDTIGPNYSGVVDPSTWWLDGYVAEIVRYRAALSGATRAGIRKALATKWGITAYYAPYMAG